MAKLTVKAGSTSRREYVFILDSASTTGAGKTGLAWNTAGWKAYYVRPGGSATSISLAVQTVTGAFSGGGFVEVDGTNMPGVYRFDVPDAVFAASAEKAIVMLSGPTGVAPVVLEYQLVAYDPDDTVRLGLTALPNVASGSAGAIITSGTGTAQLSVSSGLVTLAGVTHTGAVIPTVTSVTNSVTANTTQWGGVAVTGMPMPTYTQPTGFLAATFPATVASTTNITSVGSVSGSVGSVTSAVTVGTINSNVITAASIATDAITAAKIATDAGEEIADTVLARNVSNVETTAGEHTLCTLVLANLENSISGTTLTIKRTNGSTTHVTKTLTTNASAIPITGID